MASVHDIPIDSDDEPSVDVVLYRTLRKRGMLPREAERHARAGRDPIAAAVKRKEQGRERSRRSMAKRRAALRPNYPLLALPAPKKRVARPPLETPDVIYLSGPAGPPPLPAGVSDPFNMPALVYLAGIRHGYMLCGRYDKIAELEREVEEMRRIAASLKHHYGQGFTFVVKPSATPAAR